MPKISDSPAIPSRFHCVNCGEIWGDGQDPDSYGVCIKCFKIWAVEKQECFGEYLDNCDCSLKKFCKEYYGIK